MSQVNVSLDIFTLLFVFVLTFESVKPNNVLALRKKIAGKSFIEFSIYFLKRIVSKKKTCCLPDLKCFGALTNIIAWFWTFFSNCLL